MQFALVVQMAGQLGYVRPLVRLAREAEAAGWDAFFIWDIFEGGVAGARPVVDPWIALTAIAAATERIKFGTMVTPLPRRRPWKLARETASLDQFSNGRLILGLGSGAPDERFDRFGDPADPKVLAAMLDEGIEILTGLWKGEPFSFHGEHYRIDEALLLPTPFQQPRIPLWIGGAWPRKPPFRRAARLDGLWAAGINGNLSIPELRDVRDYVLAHRTSDAPFDIMAGGDVPFDDPPRAREMLAEYADAGVTWWLEGVGDWRGDIDAMARFIASGPPGVR